jgi:uncharacterized protein (PEP-CTERM system associated)
MLTRLHCAAQPNGRGSSRAAALSCLCLAAAPMAWAQTAVPAGRAFQITPSVSVTETVTDNALLSSNNRRSDAVTVLTAGLNAASFRPGLKGSLDYSISGSLHARETAANSTNNALQAAIAADVVDGFFTIDGSASIAQRAVSAFGVQSFDPAIDLGNRTEVRSWSVSPALRSRIGSWGQLTARHTHSESSSSTGSIGDFENDSTTVVLAGAGTTRVGWSLTGSRQTTEFDAGRKTTTDSLVGGLNYRPIPDLSLQARSGRERSDLTTAAATNGNTWGIGLEWQPSTRTRLELQRDRRYFGNSHLVSLEYRMPRSSVRISSMKDLSTSLPSFTQVGVVTLYDLFFANLASQIPDPAARRETVLRELARLGRSPTEAIGAIGFVTSAVTLSNRQDVQFALQGARTTAALQLFRNETRSIEGVSTPTGDLANGGRVRQSGFVSTLGYRLTPLSNLTLTASLQRNRGGAGLSNTLRSYNLHWASQFGLRSSVSLGARHVVFGGGSGSYTENAVLATYGYRF